MNTLPPYLRAMFVIAVAVALGGAMTTTYITSETASVAAEMQANAPLDAAQVQPQQSFGQEQFGQPLPPQEGFAQPMPPQGNQSGMQQGGQNFGGPGGPGFQGPSDEEMEKQQAANDARMVKEQKRNIQREAKDLTRILQFGGPTKKLPAVKKILDAKKAEATALQAEATVATTMDALDAVREKMQSFRESWQEQMDLLNQIQQYTGLQQYLKQRVKQLDSFVKKTAKRLGAGADVSEVTQALDRVKAYQKSLDDALNNGVLETLEQFSSEDVEEAVQEVEQKMQSLQFLADRKKMMPKMRSFVTQYNKKVAALEKRLARTKDEDDRAEIEGHLEEAKSAIDSLSGLLDEVDAAKKADDIDESIFMEIMETNAQLAQGLEVQGFGQFMEQTMKQSGYQSADYSGPKFGPQGGSQMGPGMGPGMPGQMGPGMQQGPMGSGGFEGNMGGQGGFGGPQGGPQGPQNFGPSSGGFEGGSGGAPMTIPR